MRSLITFFGGPYDGMRLQLDGRATAELRMPLLQDFRAAMRAAGPPPPDGISEVTVESRGCVRYTRRDDLGAYIFAGEDVLDE